MEELRTVSELHGYRKNPLPPPPEPVPTEYVPSFAQAMAHDRVSFKLPSETSPPTHAQSFKAQGHKFHKGKAKSLDHRSISPSQKLPTQQAKMDPSEEGPVLISHLDPYSPPSRQRPSSPTPASGLKLHFENTNQPLDAYELTQSYLREYSQGVLDGQLMAGKQSSAIQQPRASTSHIRSDVLLHDRNESIDARSSRSTRSTRGTQPVSGPCMADMHSRPLHQRHNTVSSLVTSVESSGSGSQAFRPYHPRHNTVPSMVASVEPSSTGPSSQTRSSSRSIPRSNPSLADLLSDDSPSAPGPPLHRPVPSLPTSPPNSNPNPIPSLPQPSHGHLESLLQSILTRPSSPASSRSRVSKASTWGTFRSTSTNHTVYSLLGLRDFRENFAVPPVHNSGSRSGLQRPSQQSLNSLTSWHRSTASLSPESQTQDRFSSSNGYHYEGQNENVMRRDDELLNPSYSRDSGGSRQRPMEPQRMTRGRNQPLPVLTPSPFSYGEAITEEDNGSNSNFMPMTFGNALGLELSADPMPISAPTPIVPHRTFLRSFSEES